MPAHAEARRCGEARAGARLARDAWLSEQMERPVWRLMVDEQECGAAALEAAVRSALQETIDQGGDAPLFAYARVPVTCVGGAEVLARAGFRLVDTTVTLERQAWRGEDADVTCACVRVRPATHADEDAAVALAGRAFSCSRFHMDGAIARRTADAIKAAWVRSFFRGARGDAMAVAEDGGRIVGFLLSLPAADGAFVIDLVATDARARGRGIAAAMTRFAASGLAPGTLLRVSTQLVNRPALRAYGRLGFCFASAAWVFHLHGG